MEQHIDFLLSWNSGLWNRIIMNDKIDQIDLSNNLKEQLLLRVKHHDHDELKGQVDTKRHQLWARLPRAR